MVYDKCGGFLCECETCQAYNTMLDIFLISGMVIGDRINHDSFAQLLWWDVIKYPPLHPK